MKKICVANQKGGVAKTVSTMNVGVGLVKLGKKVLLIDLDPQGDLSHYLKWDNVDQQPTISDLIYNAVARRPVDPACIRRSDEGLDYIPSDPMIGSASAILQRDSDRNKVIQRILSNEIFSGYDYILIDCKVSEDLLLDNALVASDRLLIPVQAEPFSYNAIGNMFQILQGIKQSNNPGLELEGFLITLFRPNVKLANEVFNTLMESYPQYTLPTPISFSAEVGKSTDAQKSLFQSSKSRKLADQYLAAAKYIVEKEEK